MSAISNRNDYLKFVEIIKTGRQRIGAPEASKQISSLSDALRELIVIKDHIDSTIMKMLPGSTPIDAEAYDIDLCHCVRRSVKKACKTLRHNDKNDDANYLRSALKNFDELVRKIKRTFLKLLGKPKNTKAYLEIFLEQEIDGQVRSEVMRLRTISDGADLLFEIYPAGKLVYFVYRDLEDNHKDGLKVSGERSLGRFIDDIFLEAPRFEFL